ncbi:transcription initiation factor IIB [Mycoemilia scoparia]|uniref:Transcription initiation factor IIB n=1 Tax=Mycoemilia scoparia TaxID=417184 RepID=A0A9W7ZP80_9FUNG|nr:transcription initiation factor IIB [Mycoemilia scoparia]
MASTENTAVTSGAALQPKNQNVISGIASNNGSSGDASIPGLSQGYSSGSAVSTSGPNTPTTGMSRNNSETKIKAEPQSYSSGNAFSTGGYNGPATAMSLSDSSSQANVKTELQGPNISKASGAPIKPESYQPQSFNNGASVSSLRSTSTYVPPPIPPARSTPMRHNGANMIGFGQFKKPAAGTPSVMPQNNASISSSNSPLRRDKEETAMPLVDPRTNVVLICPDCRNPTPNIMEEFAQGDLVCGDCGLVLGDRIIDTRSEWRTFANDEGDDPSRVGGALSDLTPESGLDTAIAHGGDGGSGMARELNKIHGRSTAIRHEKALMQAFKYIQTICDKDEMTKAVSTAAKKIFKELDGKKFVRGKSLDILVGISIYRGCIEGGESRTFKDVADMVNIQKKDLGRAYKEMKLHLDLVGTGTSSEILIPRYCANLSLPVMATSKALLLNSIAKERGTLAGKSPLSIAASCVYMISMLIGHPRQISALSKISRTSEVTIKNAYKKMYGERYELLDDKILEGLDKRVLETLPPS